TSWTLWGWARSGDGVTEVFLIDRIGDPFAQPAPVAGGDLGGEHRDQVMGDHDGGLPGSVGGGLAHREVDRSAAVLALLDPLLYMRAGGASARSRRRRELVGEHVAVAEDVAHPASLEQRHLALGDGCGRRRGPLRPRPGPGGRSPVVVRISSRPGCRRTRPPPRSPCPGPAAPTSRSAWRTAGPTSPRSGPGRGTAGGRAGLV